MQGVKEVKELIALLAMSVKQETSTRGTRSRVAKRRPQNQEEIDGGGVQIEGR